MFSFVTLHIIGQSGMVAFAPGRDFSIRRFRIHFRQSRIGPPHQRDSPAAGGQHTQKACLRAVSAGKQIHGIGVGQITGPAVKYDLRVYRVQGFPHRLISQMPPSGQSQRTIEHHPEVICLRMLAAKQRRRPGRPHGVGTARPAADRVEFSNGFHKTLLHGARRFFSP